MNDEKRAATEHAPAAARDSFTRLLDDARPARGGDGLPDTFVQWKGTRICLDFWCPCGATAHLDAEFCYLIRCGACGARFQVAPYLSVRPLPEGEQWTGVEVTAEPEPDDGPVNGP